jgi:hypothetical protein
MGPCFHFSFGIVGTATHMIALKYSCYFDRLLAVNLVELQPSPRTHTVLSSGPSNSPTFCHICHFVPVPL